MSAVGRSDGRPVRWHGPGTDDRSSQVATDGRGGRGRVAARRAGRGARGSTPQAKLEH